MSSDKSNFERLLEAGKMTVTAEIGPPMTADGENVSKKARDMREYVDAVYLTDNQTAMVRMSSIASAKLCLDEGLEPIVQMTCRDRNRIAIQSDMLGAYALGARNLLVLSGDHQSFGNHTTSKNVYDVDSTQLIWAMNNLQEEATFMGGSACKIPPRFFIGGACHPFADPKELQIMRVKKKIDGGAKFITTQSIYDIEQFKEFMKIMRDMGLTERAYFQASVLVNKSLKSLEMTKLVPGMVVPDKLIERMAGVPKEAQQDEGVNIAVDLINEVKEIEGVKGIHIQAVGWESIVPKVAEKAGFLPRPQVVLSEV